MPTIVGMAPYAGKLKTGHGNPSAVMCTIRFT